RIALTAGDQEFFVILLPCAWHRQRSRSAMQLSRQEPAWVRTKRHRPTDGGEASAAARAMDAWRSPAWTTARFTCGTPRTPSRAWRSAPMNGAGSPTTPRRAASTTPETISENCTWPENLRPGENCTRQPMEVFRELRTE